jgi:hypothetical protein
LEEAISMIVIGVDVHKHSLTAVAVDERGRLLAERTLRAPRTGLSPGRPGSTARACGRWRIAAT